MNFISSKQHKALSFQKLTICCWTLLLVTRTRKATLSNFLNKQYVAMCVSQFRTSLVLCRVLSEFCRVCAKKKLPVPISLTSSAFGASLAAFPLVNSFQIFSKCVGFSWYCNFVIIPQSMFMLLLFWINSKDHFLFMAIHISVKHNSDPF